MLDLKAANAVLSSRRPPSSLLEEPDVSVCIVNWNCRSLLRTCLESLRSSSQGIRLETIVVDNSSTDGAADMVARDFPEVILQRNSANLGFARANNQAARMARGRYLFFLNNDTVVPPGALARLVVYAVANPEAGMIGPRLRDGQGRVQVSYRSRPTVATFLNRTSLIRWTGLLRRGYRRYRRPDRPPTTPLAVEVLMGAAMLLPRDVFFACGSWDEDFTFGGEDLALCHRVGRQYQLIYQAEVEILHHGRASTRQHISYAGPHIAIGFLRYLRKSGSRPLALLAYKVVITLDAPVQMLDKGLQYLWRRLRGRSAEAEKSLLIVRGQWHFLVKGLLPFWKT